MAEQFDSLVDMQERSCRRFGDHPLFGTKHGDHYHWSTYAEFAAAVDEARGGLASLGVGRGTPVAIIANNRAEWAIAAYATYSLGGIFVPMYEDQQPREWAYIIADSEARVVFAAKPEILARLREFADEIPTFEHVVAIEGPEDQPGTLAHLRKIGRKTSVPSVKPAGDDIAGIVYTSGTTGLPKGVVLSHGNFVANVNAVHLIYDIRPEDVVCSFLPWAHSFGQTAELHLMISLGVQIGLAEGTKTLIDDIVLVRPTVLIAVPRIFNRIYDGLQKRIAGESKLKQFLFHRAVRVAVQRRKLAERNQSSTLLNLEHAVLDRLVFKKVRARFGGRLKFCISGGAALATEVAEFISDVGLTVYEGYGLTETAPVCSVNTPEHNRIGTIGRPLPNVEIYICDESQQVLPPNTEGEIVIVGPNVMVGYHKLPEETAKVIFDLNGKRAFRTGDMGLETDDGFIKVTGRFKEQYKLENGKYVVPTPAEEQLKLSGYISQAFLYGENRPYNVALVVPDFDAITKFAKERALPDLSPAALTQHPDVHAKIGEELAHYGEPLKAYERPKKWVILEEEFTVDNQLLTPKLSVKRHNVVKQYSDLIESLYATPAE